MHKIFGLVTLLLLTFNSLAQQPEPDTSCLTADIFCIEEDFQNPNGSQTIYTLPDTIPGLNTLEFPNELCSEGGKPNNILFFNFVPNSPTVTIQINSIGCDEGFNGDLGYQWGVYDSCDEVFENSPSSIICEAFMNGSDPWIGLSTGTSDQFIPGHTYVLFVDGFGGSVCDFTVTIVEGMSTVADPFEVTEPTHFTNSSGDLMLFGDTIDFCKDGFFTTTAHGSDNADTYIWSVINGNSETILNSDADTLDFYFTKADSIYQICSVAHTDCDDSEQYCFYVDVFQEPHDSLGTLNYCMDDLTLGIIPPDWEGEEIFAPGEYFHTVKDSILGCTHFQIVTIVGQVDQIESLDTIICNADTLFYNGDTIVNDYFQKDYVFIDGAKNGCDSILQFTAQKFDIEATLSGLSCIDQEFGLEVIIDQMTPSDPDSIKITWFKDGIPYAFGDADELQLKINDTGLYDAMLSIYKNGVNCVFDLNQVNVDVFVSTDFSITQDSICQSDVITVSLDEYNSSAVYTWLNADHVNEIIPGTYELSWDQEGSYNLSLNVDFQSCELNSSNHIIYVEKVLDPPTIDCIYTNNDSISVEFDLIDCASVYEVWLNGSLLELNTSGAVTMNGLEEGQDYEIIVVALSDCLCPSSADTIICTTEECLENVVLTLDQLPLSYCMDEFTSDIQLSGQVSGSTGGSINWDGSIVDANGLISFAGVTAGSYPITMEYLIENCSYIITDTFHLYDSVDFELDFNDLSCFNTQDGMIDILPIAGSAPFKLMVNGVEYQDLLLTNLNEGEYDIQFSDKNGCIKSDLISLFKPERPIIDITGTRLIERGQTYDYELSLEGMVYDSVVWYVPSLDTTLCAGICDIISYAPYFDQELCIEIFFDEVCKMDTCIQLKVNRDVNVYLPNVFSPGNNDGVNDHFMIKTNAIDPIDVQQFLIFDRWGNMLFNKSGSLVSSSTDDSYGWDGTFKGQDVVSGVYVYFLEYKDSKGKIIQLVGDVALLR